MAKQTKKPDSQPSRGAQRRAQQREQRLARERELPPSAPVPEPAFFFGFEVAWAKLVVVRVVFFALLALDALLQISHAPRYGAGGFNVAQIPFLDAIAPGREAFAIAELVQAYLFVLAACGVATRVVLPIATVVYGWLYFGSHLDSYQHHYLVWLLCLIGCFVPWQRPPDAVPATRVRTWAVRVMLIQLAILYFWAAVSKMNVAWLDGRTLSMQMHGSIESLITSTIGFPWAARFVVVGELAIAATIWYRPGWKIAAPLGLALHLGIAKTNLEIGLFAWLMVALYALVIPDRVWVWLLEGSMNLLALFLLLLLLLGLGGLVVGGAAYWGGGVGLIVIVCLLGYLIGGFDQPLRPFRNGVRWIAEIFRGSLRFAWWAVAAAAAAVLAMLSRFADGPAIGLALVVALLVGTVFAVLRHKTQVAWLATAHLLAFVLWTAVDRTTTTASDYYRFWGGSARRLGDPRMAERAYRQMTEVEPGEGQGWYQLGKLLLAREAGDEGLEALHHAQDVEPLRARSYVAEARWLAKHGRRDEAIGKAREATIVEPSDAEAKALLDSLLGSR